MVKLSCGSCGAKLEITDNVNRFACVHCGSEWLIERGGGIVSLKAVEKSLRDISETLKESKTYDSVKQQEEYRSRANMEIQAKQTVEAAKGLGGCFTVLFIISMLISALLMMIFH